MDSVDSIVDKTLKTAGDPEMARTLIRRFFDELHGYEKKLPSRVTETERLSLAMDLHKLVGACAYFGATELSLVATEAEQVVKSGDIALADVQLNKVRHLVSEVVKLEQAVLSIL